VAKKPKRGIQGTVKRPGALRQRLEGLGLAKPGQPIPASVPREVVTGKYGPKTARRARFALNMRGLAQ
nr:hypothetical protein [Dehalococcoidales bacterium]